jgi:hypothetical protein
LSAGSGAGFRISSSFKTTPEKLQGEKSGLETFFWEQIGFYTNNLLRK